MKTLSQLLFLLLFQLQLHAQIRPVDYHTEIIFNFTHQNDSTLAHTRKTTLSKLMIGEKESHFLTVPKSIVDSTVASETQKGMYNRYGGISPNNFLIVKSANIIETFEPVNGIEFYGNNEVSYYEQKKSEMKWEIHQDTIKRGSFIAQKATTNWGGRKWTAWFTMDVPISEGPYKFCGLPGLIIAVSDQDKYFSFELVSVRPVKRTSLNFESIRPDISLTKTSVGAFYADRKKLRENMVEVAIAKGERFTEEIKQSIIKQAKSDNNFIERY